MINQLFFINDIITIRDSSCVKVMFLHLSVILFTRGHARKGHAWQRGDMHGRGCMAEGGSNVW